MLKYERTQNNICQRLKTSLVLLNISYRWDNYTQTKLQLHHFFFIFDVEIKRIKQKSKILTAPLTNSSILCGLTCGLFTVIRSLKKPCNTRYKHEEDNLFHKLMRSSFARKTVRFLKKKFILAIDITKIKFINNIIWHITSKWSLKNVQVSKPVDAFSPSIPHDKHHNDSKSEKNRGFLDQHP